MTEVLTTCSIMTNCALVGFVSHGILFYFPDISPNQRVTKLSPASFTTHTLSPASLYIRNLEGGGSTVLGASRPPPPLLPLPLPTRRIHCARDWHPALSNAYRMWYCVGPLQLREALSPLLPLRAMSASRLKGVGWDPALSNVSALSSMSASRLNS